MEYDLPVAQMARGDDIEGFYVLKSAFSKVANNGKPFLNLTLSDRTGAVDAKVWDYPGPIGAASERARVTAELICDGHHVHPSAVRMAFRLFPHRICLISDALRCCGMPDGPYTLGGQAVFLSGGVARLSDGTIAGSAANLYDCMRNAVAFGIPAEEAVLAATAIPARALGRSGEAGAIADGLPADFVVCGPALERRAVYLRGRQLQPY